ncbi:hypothetical protein FPSE_06473 [Fusarium pseudograminearum CS3096]|uniref:Uncharacterized protein n=1 Tax=Fusarium pseudograminearum (strain CS3096) TaxID=1028729 RepID=K3UMH1_FUSPC|nr:hypothetical protein FPSE_06473 [Fusarium pseudograminearum CS3096]EKJ73316.1 hypothetical protein FPSE_06473 [Fusarium pseudograminearum CS3096]
MRRLLHCRSLLGTCKRKFQDNNDERRTRTSSIKTYQAKQGPYFEQQ